jgi:hypothetical protein
VFAVVVKKIQIIILKYLISHYFYFCLSYNFNLKLLTSPQVFAWAGKHLWAILEHFKDTYLSGGDVLSFRE